MLCDQHPVASLGKNMGRGYTTLIRIVGLGIELIVAAYDRRRRLAIYIYIYIYRSGSSPSSSCQTAATCF